MPEPWSVTDCQHVLWEACYQLTHVIAELQDLREVLPLPDDLDDRLENRRAYDVPTDILATIECVIEDCLKPALTSLEGSATATNDDLAAEFERWKAKSWTA
jgi:hypothetical protein